MRSVASRACVAVCVLMGCAKERAPEPVVAAPQAMTPEMLSEHCREAVGEPRVLQLSERIFAAIGYDLANTIVIKTDTGRVVVDVMMSPERAAEAKAALDARVPGPTQAIIYTHSHIDHVGGASVWMEPGTEIWATDALPGHFLKQYGVFQAAERARGLRQFGAQLSDAELPCSALGRRPDFSANVGGGFHMPTHTFSGTRALEIGGVKLELVEAHGETDDQLFVWLPSERALLPGDNYYQAFPNLYTIRGTRARPVDRWISSLDAMRRRAPELLVPSHTIPVRGGAEIASRLTDYRDAIAHLYARVVEHANAGGTRASLTDHARLPAHLADKPHLFPLYGELHWSLLAMYDNELGWFDGHTEHLYPLAGDELARREVALMGGAEKIFQLASKALDAQDARWALHLLSKLQAAGSLPPERMTPLWARAERALGEHTVNTNGRAYLLVSAQEHEGKHHAFKPKLEGGLLDAIPVRAFFEAMPSRLKADEARDVHASLAVALTDLNTRFHVTIRRGVAEVVEGEPLPFTPEPFATLTTDSATYKALALKQMMPLVAIATGKLSVQGDTLRVPEFLAHFRQDI